MSSGSRSKRETSASKGSGSGTYSAPSIAELQNRLVVLTAEGPNAELDLWWQSIGDLGWSFEQVAGTGTTHSEAPVSQLGSNLV